MTEEKKKEIAKGLCDIGYNNTLSGNYHFDFDYVAEMFGVSVDEIINNKSDIASYIDADERIISETWIETDFDLLFESDED